MTRRWRLLAALVVVALGLATAAGAQDSSDLASVKSRVREIRSQLEDAQARAKDANAELADADARLAEVEAAVNEVARKLEQQSSRVEQAKAELQRLEDEANAVQEAFDARAIEMFKHAYGSDLDVILSAQDIQTAIDRSTLLQAVNRSDRATLEQVAAAHARVENQQQVLASETERLQQMQVEQQAILEDVRAIRQSRAMAAAAARAQVAELEQEKEDLEADQARIERLIRARSAPPATLSPPSVSGYIWPLCGTVTSEYGRRWGRLHAGIDIDDNLSKAIVAAKTGTVIFTGWSSGYGNLTLIDHGDGVVTAYGHQAAISVSEGQRVGQGQRIGTVGATGHATGTHLHFETRVHGSAVNPRRFLPPSC